MRKYNECLAKSRFAFSKTHLSTNWRLSIHNIQLRRYVCNYIYALMEYFIILLLTLLNGIFAMTEIALVSSRKFKLENKAKKGHSGAAKALELMLHLADCCPLYKLASH